MNLYLTVDRFDKPVLTEFLLGLLLTTYLPILTRFSPNLPEQVTFRELS